MCIPILAWNECPWNMYLSCNLFRYQRVWYYYTFLHDFIRIGSTVVGWQLPLLSYLGPNTDMAAKTSGWSQKWSLVDEGLRRSFRPNLGPYERHPVWCTYWLVAARSPGLQHGGSKRARGKRPTRGFVLETMKLQRPCLRTVKSGLQINTSEGDSLFEMRVFFFRWCPPCHWISKA